MPSLAVKIMKNQFSHMWTWQASCQQLIGLCHSDSLDIEILDNRGKHQPNYIAPHVVKYQKYISVSGMEALQFKIAKIPSLSHS